PIGLALRNGRDRPQRVEVELRIPAGDEAIGKGRECGRLEARRRGKVERLLSRDAPNRRGPHGAGERLPEQRAGRLFIEAQGAVFYPEGFDLVVVSNPPFSISDRTDQRAGTRMAVGIFDEPQGDSHTPTIPRAISRPSIHKDLQTQRDRWIAKFAIPIPIAWQHAAAWIRLVG